MGFLDVIRGRKDLKQPAADRIFAMTTANVQFEMGLQIKTRGAAGIVFQPLATADFESIITDMKELVAGLSSDAETALETSDDEFGYRWIVLRDPDVEDLVVGINGVSTALVGGGYGERILAAVFAFEDANRKPIYFIYNYKRGTFYPFVPGGGAQQRDNERELQLKAQIGAELPLEPDLERWFPLWGIPI